jgi:hypothetical protein
MLAQARTTAREAIWIVGAPRERRLMIEPALERLDGLRDRLIDRLDAMDGDTDLEPSLGATDWRDQRVWFSGCPDDREGESDFEHADFGH